MTFPVHNKILVGGNILEQVSHFSFLGCDISYVSHDDNGTNKNIDMYQTMHGTIQRTLRNKTRLDMKMKFYKALTIPHYGCDDTL